MRSRLGLLGLLLICGCGKSVSERESTGTYSVMEFAAAYDEKMGGKVVTLKAAGPRKFTNKMYAFEYGLTQVVCHYESAEMAERSVRPGYGIKGWVGVPSQSGLHTVIPLFECIAVYMP